MVIHETAPVKGLEDIINMGILSSYAL